VIPVADRNYSKDPVPVRDNKKLYAVIIAVAVIFIVFQVVMRFIPGKHEKTAPSQNLVEDKARTVFKETDIAKSFEVFGRGAKESALKKLEARAQKKDQASESRAERLGPVKIMRPEKQVLPEAAVQLQIQKPLNVPLGTQIFALLKTGIFSFNTENHVEAQATQDVYYLGKLGIPKGTKFFGTVSVVHSENRVNIRFYRLLLPWGEERTCQAVAHSLDGSGGLKGKVNHRWFTRTFSIVGKTALSGLTLLTVPNRQSAFSAQDQLRLTASSNLAQEGSRELGNLKIEKSITVQGGIPIKIILLESL
jgi:type IV secretory pathway VirB10-like protein